MVEHGSVDLAGYLVQQASDINKPFGFKATKPGHRTFFFSADNEEDRARWMTAMTQAANALNEMHRGLSRRATNPLGREEGISSECGTLILTLSPCHRLCAVAELEMRAQVEVAREQALAQLG